MFAASLLSQAEALLAQCRTAGLMIATAESCTGGLIAGLLTEVPGSSDVFDRGFVTYSNDAKTQMLDVSAELIRTHGAVSEHVAHAMAQGALNHSRAHITVAVTGVAGPGGGSADKPVGLVHLAAMRGDKAITRVCHFGDIGRDQVRLKTVETALVLLAELV